MSQRPGQVQINLPSEPIRSAARWGSIRRVLGGLLLALVALFATLGPLVLNQDPAEQNLAQSLLKAYPSSR